MHMQDAHMARDYLASPLKIGEGMDMSPSLAAGGVPMPDLNFSALPPAALLPHSAAAPSGLSRFQSVRANSCPWANGVVHDTASRCFEAFTPHSVQCGQCKEYPTSGLPAFDPSLICTYLIFSIPRRPVSIQAV